MKTAAYTRYSSDKQRNASIDDQLRNIVNHCQRHNLPEPIHYSDAAISGATLTRPGLDAMLAAAAGGKFNILLVDDQSRLGRDMSETPKLINLLKFQGVRVIGVSDGIDTERNGYKIEVGLRGIMAEAYLDELAQKTHRGLTGLAMNGYSAGGLPYGYTSEHDGDGYKRRIDPAQADTVRRIFEQYAAGQTPRQIAAALNADGIKSPRGSTWAASAINGDRKRGIGLLNNPIYNGLQIWNKSKWIKDPQTKTRKRFERPPSEWIIHEAPELAIISPTIWNAVKARQNQLDQRLSEARKTRPRSKGGRQPAHLLSGVITCGVCGSNYTIIDRYRYGCARHKDRGPAACKNNFKIAKTKIEAIILQDIRKKLDTEQAFKQFERETRRLIKQHQPDDSAARANLKQAEKEIENIMQAIKAGIFTTSTKTALESAESAKNKALADISRIGKSSPVSMLPRAREVYKRLVKQITEIKDIKQAREAIKQITGGVIITPRDDAVYAEFRDLESQIRMVAGACYESNLTHNPAFKIADYTGKP